mgnify:CR=1 FL=1
MDHRKKNRRNKLKRLPGLVCACLLAVLLLTSCTPSNQGGTGDSAPPEAEGSGSGGGGDSAQGDSAPPDEASALEERVRQKLSQMTLEEKAAQLFMITPEALTGEETVTAADGATYDALKARPVGGLVYFGENIVAPDQLKAMTGSTQQYAEETQGMPLLLAIDEEGGAVARIGHNPNFAVKKYPDMASIGADGRFETAYEVGQTIGSYLREYGLNLDFAPDADVLTNPRNTVIGSRSFGTDGKRVAKMALGVAKGLADQGILPCFKHFPGHGATEGDTHAGFAYTNRTLDEMKESELIPFQAAADNHIPFIMISHISAPNVVGDNTPASLSQEMITGILRGQMGYDGVVITDAMEMGAIANTYGAKDAVIRSLQAGADIILMPQDFEEAYKGVLDAVADGTLSVQRIDESLERILRVKLAL